MFQTKYQRIEVPAEKNSGELLVEQEFVSTERQILSMLRAGERLRVYRKESCDLQDGEEDFILDPTREPNFDLADASQIMSGIKPIPIEQTNETDVPSNIPVKETVNE